MPNTKITLKTMIGKPEQDTGDAVASIRETVTALTYTDIRESSPTT